MVWTPDVAWAAETSSSGQNAGTVGVVAGFGLLGVWFIACAVGFIRARNARLGRERSLTGPTADVAPPDPAAPEST